MLRRRRYSGRWQSESDESPRALDRRHPLDVSERDAGASGLL